MFNKNLIKELEFKEQIINLQLLRINDLIEINKIKESYIKDLRNIIKKKDYWEIFKDLTKQNERESDNTN